jgi:hypothetical protein
MGIKNEEPEDRVIFDSIDNRMKYSKGIKMSGLEGESKCKDCYFKESSPAKNPCNACLNTDNLDCYAPIPNVARQAVGLELKTDNPKTMDDIYNLLKEILEELKNGKKED